VNKFIAVLVFIFGVAFVCTKASADLTPEESARMATDEWLALVDGGKYPESWDKMDADFKKEVSQHKWKSAITAIRKPLGAVTSRKFQSAQYSKDLPGAPEGEYVVVRFKSAFKRKGAATETVTLKLGQDLNWRVSTYAVK
jgi:hypothetical protein